MEPELYYDLDGRPISRDEWARLMTLKHEARRAGNDGDTRPGDDPSRIGSDHVGDVWVSTVWLGLDHNWGPGPPLIFETMVFGGPDDQEQERYPSRVAALAGHDRWVARQRELNAGSSS
jgi:hypothetical protein